MKSINHSTALSACFILELSSELIWSGGWKHCQPESYSVCVCFTGVYKYLFGNFSSNSRLRRRDFPSSPSHWTGTFCSIQSRCLVHFDVSVQMLPAGSKWNWCNRNQLVKVLTVNWSKAYRSKLVAELYVGHRHPLNIHHFYLIRANKADQITRQPKQEGNKS